MGPAGADRRSDGGGCGFPAANRLRKRREYLAVQGSGQKIHTRHFIIAVLRREDSDGEPGRLGVTVSKRVGNAVTRNRIKRLVREFVRQHDWLPVGGDVVVIAKGGAAKACTFAEVAADLAGVQRRLSC